MHAVIQNADGSLHAIPEVFSAGRTGRVAVRLDGVRSALTKSAVTQPQIASAAIPRLTI